MQPDNLSYFWWANSFAAMSARKGLTYVDFGTQIWGCAPKLTVGAPAPLALATGSRSRIPMFRCYRAEKETRRDDVVWISRLGGGRPGGCEKLPRADSHVCSDVWPAFQIVGQGW